MYGFSPSTPAGLLFFVPAIDVFSRIIAIGHCRVLGFYNWKQKAKYLLYHVGFIEFKFLFKSQMFSGFKNL